MAFSSSSMDPDAVAPAVQPVRPRRGGGCLLGFGLGCLSAWLICVLAPLILFGCACYFLRNTTQELVSRAGCSTYGAPNYTILRGCEDGKQVLRLELRGIISGDSTSRWYLPPDSDAAVRQAIETAILDEEIRGLLLIVDSPGGSVTASDELYHALERFKAALPDRRIVVLGQDILASGAYYLAMQADWIRLQPTGLVGSIGVIVPGVNLSGLAARLGIADNSLASGASKDLGNPLKPINPEHNAILQTVVDGMYRRFTALVAKGRHLPEAEVRHLADGRVFLPEDARNLRLIDDIGYEDTLDSKLAELLECGVESLTILEPAAVHNPFKVFLSEFPMALGRGLSAPFAALPEQKPQYRW